MVLEMGKILFTHIESLKKIKAYTQVVMLCDDVPNFSDRCEPNASTKQWVPPPEDWVKANVDAAVFSESERMGAGCVIRDHNGNFLAATNQVICRVSEPEMAEALAVRWALKFICDQHFKKVVIASDCLNLVRKLMQKSLDRSHIGAIVQDIKMMKTTLMIFLLSLLVEIVMR